MDYQRIRNDIYSRCAAVDLPEYHRSLTAETSAPKCVRLSLLQVRGVISRLDSFHLTM